MKIAIEAKYWEGDMTPEEINRLIKMMPKGLSFVLSRGHWIHTCERIFRPEEPAYTSADMCGRCWYDSKEK